MASLQYSRFSEVKPFLTGRQCWVLRSAAADAIHSGELSCTIFAVEAEKVDFMEYIKSPQTARLSRRDGEIVHGRRLDDAVQLFLWADGRETPGLRAQLEKMGLQVSTYGLPVPSSRVGVGASAAPSLPSLPNSLGEQYHANMVDALANTEMREGTTIDYAILADQPGQKKARTRVFTIIKLRPQEFIPWYEVTMTSDQPATFKTNGMVHRVFGAVVEGKFRWLLRQPSDEDIVAPYFKERKGQKYQVDRSFYDYAQQMEEEKLAAQKAAKKAAKKQRREAAATATTTEMDEQALADQEAEAEAEQARKREKAKAKKRAQKDRKKAEAAAALAKAKESIFEFARSENGVEVYERVGNAGNTRILHIFDRETDRVKVKFVTLPRQSTQTAAQSDESRDWWRNQLLNQTDVQASDTQEDDDEQEEEETDATPKSGQNLNPMAMRPDLQKQIGKGLGKLLNKGRTKATHTQDEDDEQKDELVDFELGNPNGSNNSPARGVQGEGLQIVHFSTDEERDRAIARAGAGGGMVVDKEDASDGARKRKR